MLPRSARPAARSPLHVAPQGTEGLPLIIFRLRAALISARRCALLELELCAEAITDLDLVLCNLGLVRTQILKQRGAHGGDVVAEAQEGGVGL
jgi:hypothetical protein